MFDAFSLAVPPILGIVVGAFVDRQFGTAPWWTLGLLIFGCMTAAWTVYKRMPPARSFKPKEPPDPPPP